MLAPTMQAAKTPRVCARQRRSSVAEDLLAWYDTHRRDLPWRAKPGEKSDPYRVWLSEIMLQQTTVAAVTGYYRNFLTRWPSVAALAGASLDDVLGAWAGLGYYSRARNLHRTARIVVEEHGGRFPQSCSSLRELPGIGPYTAGAIASIAFGERVAALDANGERVMARLFALEEPLPLARRKMPALADALVPEDRPGDFAQALMDLGSLVCTPKAPSCLLCPLNRHCEGYRLGIAERLPVKAAKPERPLKRGAAYVAFDTSGAVLLEKRPETGLLGGMLQPPLGTWRASFPKTDEALADAPFHGAWRKRDGFVRHVFTHFALEIEVYTAVFARRPNAEGQWLEPERLAGAALPTVMRKLIGHARGDGLS
jgi:A/G-specific adenine glycosylase